jgi:putative endonuclease
MAKHITLGKKGEALAKTFLEEKGFAILDTNWRHEKDEIDIVAMDGAELVIVEVKTRSTDFFGAPHESVGYRKEQFLIRATESYLEEKDLDVDSRFDIISIVINQKGVQIEHIEDAFYPQ